MKSQIIVALGLIQAAASAGPAAPGAAAAPATAARLEKDFADPPMECRPRTRYWWFGGAVTREQLARQLTGMKAQGLGGVEIQSCYDLKPAAPDHKVADFAGPEWVRRVVACIEEAGKLGLKVDLTPGSGWPYGGPVATPRWMPKYLKWETVRIEGPAHFDGNVPNQTGRAFARLVAITVVRAAGKDTLRPADVPARVVTGLARPEGNMPIQIDVDEGNWLLTSFWSDPGGIAVKRAGAGGTGRIIDHYNPEAMERQLNWAVKPVLDAAGGHVGSTLQAIFFDSWELGKPTWTERFPKEFETRRGYDITPFLPLVFVYGRAQPGSLAARVKHDYNLTIRDMIVENCFGTLRDWCRRRGLRSRVQAHGSPTDLVDAYGAADIPEFEVYRRTPRGADHARWAGNVFARNVVSCESFTWLAPRYQCTLRDMRQEADLICARGANQFVFHGYSYTPPAAGWPGWHFYASCEINHTNPFWAYLRPLTDAIARNCFMLRAGRPVAEICVHGRGYKPDPARLYDRITDRALLTLAQVEDGMLTVGHGRYRALVLTDAKVLPLKTIEKIEALTRKGLAVVTFALPADVPGFHRHESQAEEVRRIAERLFPKAPAKRPRTVGAGKTWHLAAAGDLNGVLDQLRIAPPLLAPAGWKGDWLHRRGQDFDCFFLRNAADKDISGKFSFPAKGAAELWDAASGRIAPAPHRTADGRTIVELTIAPRRSALVMIRRDAPAPRPAAGGTAGLRVITTIGGSWKVAFKHADGSAPVHAAFGRLEDWSRREGLEAFAGVGTYSIAFNVEKLPAGGAAALLDLGAVGDVARVTLNARPCGIAFEPPYRLDVTAALKAGRNDLVVEVANRMANGVKGEEAPAKPFPSGLMGPVRLLAR